MIQYINSKIISATDYIELLNSSTLGLRRPIKQFDRIQKMINNSNILCTAWDNNLLIGVARGSSDFAFDCYISDLAVRQEYQHQGVGKNLIREVKKIIGDDVLLLLLSAPAALEYYPKIGLQKIDNAFIIPRKTS